MLKIIKNNTSIKELQDQKYILYSVVSGIPMYAKIGFKPIFGHILALIKFGK